jgi:hypothetical protein
MILALGGAAHATTVTDATGDFVPSYKGPHQADLDVTSFSVTYNSGLQSFLLQSTMAGAIDPTLGGFYAIGVNTGTGTGNFGSIGFAGVKFNSVIAVQKDGTAKIGATSLAAGSVIIGGNALSVMVPLSLLTSTGFTPERYAFNIWPRSGSVGGASAISDFAPNNATVSSVALNASAPEPATWATMVVGFGLCGATLRSRRTQTLLVA